MKKIIALKGPGNSGKTSTLKFVFDFLKTKYPNAPILILKSGSGEIKVIITINGKQVGIESQGDPNSRLEKSLEDFDKEGCEIIFCATRTRGMTVDWVEHYKPSYSVIFIDKKRDLSGQHDQSNQKMAQNMINQGGL